LKGISRIVGEAVASGGARRPLYEALRRLLCSACGAAIPEGARFTRHAPPGGGEPVMPRCARCAPFEEAGAHRSPLLDSLLKPAGREARQDARDPSAAKAVAERLGPALARSRKPRGGG
jgi:predicted RNA-binding Zn-ribbon protein involved in translation (DUF1610 family)